MKMTDLKPCPFCGSKALITRFEQGIDAYFVVCGNPKCSAGLGVELPETEAIAAWNTRTEKKPTDAVREFAERYEKRIAELEKQIAERTCRNSKDKWSGLAKYLFVCSECGWNLADVGNDAIDISARLMKRCPMCGAKVVSE